MRMKTIKFLSMIALALTGAACDEYVNEMPEPPAPRQEIIQTDSSGTAIPAPTLRDIAKAISELPMRQDQLNEVYEAVSSSSSNGYDEEYMMSDLFLAPGCGVGTKAADRATKGVEYRTPLRDLLTDYLMEKYATKSGAADVEAYINSLIESDAQIYWPYSEDWDGHTFPIVTFDPGYGAESNYGYEIRFDASGARVVDSVFVDEKVAAERPVWVINTNDDSAFTPLDMFLDNNGTKADSEPMKTLYLEDFTMLRNYDSWFGGASEFHIQCGGASGFKAMTDEELNKYYPAVTDFVIVVKRKQVGQPVPFDAVLVSDLTSQIEKIAFLMTEDDGGTTTSWKCAATVKYGSKSYGFDLNLPYRDKDDIVWRGQLAAAYFQEGETTGRFGDVVVTFRLE